MRKHDVRKWLHAVLDLLPVILIPVFMIYSHRHDVAQDFEVVEQVPVYYETNEVSSINDLVVGNVYRWTDNYTPSYFPTVYDSLFRIEKTPNLRQYIGNSYDFDTTKNYNFMITPTSGTVILWFQDANDLSHSISMDNKPFDFVIQYFNSSFQSTQYLISNISSSDALFVKEYRDVVTTIPKDVMTSFVDRFNNTINQYFNMGNVFNLNGVYEWFNINIFSGNAPTVIYSIWNIALYELVMDLLFLLYALFMWFIDMVEHLMEKPFKSFK